MTEGMDMEEFKGRFLGKEGDKMFVTWDVIPYCRTQNCPAFELCRAIDLDNLEETKKCKVMIDYVQSINLVIYRNIITRANESQMMRIGLELIPLYKTLCKLKLEEIGIRTVISTDDKGRESASPIYKEIRETLKLIAITWKSIGVEEPTEIPPPGGRKSVVCTDEKGNIIEGDFQHGNPHYHKQLEEQIRKEQEERDKDKKQGRLIQT